MITCSRLYPAVVAGTLLVLLPSSVRAQSADPDDVAAGFSLFRKKADCQTCHGWAGDGRKLDSQAADGANLRETKLDRATVVMTIKCGRPPSEMPAFDKFAYSDGRCYGKRKADLDASGIRVPDPPATLTAREIENVADFLFAKVIGQGPMDHAKCVAYWGEDVEVCAEFPK
jgi:Cytochrome C oxidase, cbb3-type, subunit III